MDKKYLKFLTSGLASKAWPNFLSSSGGPVWSVSAPNIDIGTLTPKIYHKKVSFIAFIKLKPEEPANLPNLKSSIIY